MNRLPEAPKPTDILPVAAEPQQIGVDATPGTVPKIFTDRYSKAFQPVKAMITNVIEVDTSQQMVPTVVVGDSVTLNNGSSWEVADVTQEQICLKNDKSKIHNVKITAKGVYCGGNQLRIARIKRSPTIVSIQTGTIPAPTPESLTNDQLVEITVGMFQRIQDSMPYIMELRMRFKDAPRHKANIGGCSGWEEFCEKHLHRTASAIRKAIQAEVNFANPNSVSRKRVNVNANHPLKTTVMPADVVPQILGFIDVAIADMNVADKTIVYQSLKDEIEERLTVTK